VRVITKCLELTDEGEEDYPLNFEMVLDADDRRVPEKNTYGWEGFAGTPDERWPFIVTPDNNLDFGIYTGRDYTRHRPLEFPGQVKIGATIRMDDDGTRSAYRIIRIQDV
jgi:hypothetical protein